jgi:hypothetical protein
MKLIPMQEQVLDSTPWIQACCQDARGQPCAGRSDVLRDAYRHRRDHRVPRAQRTGTGCGIWGRQRFVHTLMWKHQRSRSQRHPALSLRPPTRSTPWHGAHFLSPRCVLQSRKSPGRHPIRRARCLSSRPHDTPILYHGPAVHRGYNQPAPHALFYRATRSFDHAC